VYWARVVRSEADLDSQGLWIVYGASPNNRTIQCKIYATMYSMNATYVNNVFNGVWDKGSLDQIPASLTDPMINGTNFPSNWTLFNLYTIADTVGSNLLSGNVRISPGVLSNSQVILYPSLLDFFTQKGNKSDGVVLAEPDAFPHIVEQLLMRVTLELAGSAGQNTQSSASDDAFTYPTIGDFNPLAVQYTPWGAHFEYEPELLWIAYGPALGVVLICLVVGCYMLWRNGVEADMSSAQILVSARNESLDRKSEGATMGGHYISNDLRNVVLKYGELERKDGIQDGVKHLGFGLVDEVAG
jgi:hypothetical protein